MNLKHIMQTEGLYTVKSMIPCIRNSKKRQNYKSRNLLSVATGQDSRWGLTENVLHYDYGAWSGGYITEQTY